MGRLIISFKVGAGGKDRWAHPESSVVISVGAAGWGRATGGTAGVGRATGGEAGPATRCLRACTLRPALCLGP